MGCTESVPVVTAFDVLHKPDPRIICLGGEGRIDHRVDPFSVGIDPFQRQCILVKEKLMSSWSGDSFKIRRLMDNGQVTAFGYGDGLEVKGKAFSQRKRMVLQSILTKEPIAICLRVFTTFSPDRFKIYTPTPNYLNQKASKQSHNKRQLYTFGEVQNVPFSFERHVYIEVPGGRIPCYSIERVGSMFSKKRVVKSFTTRQPVALMEGGSWMSMGNSYKLTIAPGFDPCLTICICTICDELDEQE